MLAASAALLFSTFIPVSFAESLPAVINSASVDAGTVSVTINGGGFNAVRNLKVFLGGVAAELPLVSRTDGVLVALLPAGLAPGSYSVIVSGTRGVAANSTRDEEEFFFTVGAMGAVGPQGPKGDKGATGAQGPKGDTGATGASGPIAGLTIVLGAVGADTYGTRTATASCTGGKKVVGGGFNTLNVSDSRTIAITGSYPSGATVWTVKGTTEQSGMSRSYSLQAYAICATAS